MASPYSSRYYEGLKEDSAASARETVPLVLGMVPARSVVDVGCGSGTWARAYADAGCSVLGIDGDIVRPEQLLIPVESFQRANLAQPLRLDRTFDLVNCLEVAEHLDGSRADGFVADLARLGDAILFSAAVPGQGGTHHVNEQWASYWISRFQSQGFTALDAIRPQLWDNPKVAWWYVQNAFLFIRTSRLGDFRQALAHRPGASAGLRSRHRAVRNVPAHAEGGRSRAAHLPRQGAQASARRLNRIRAQADSITTLV